MTSPTAASITDTGITAPTFAEIYSYLVGQYQGIFGADIYITPDSQDGQFLAIIAAAINDSNAAAIAIYNSFSPATAQGQALSSCSHSRETRKSGQYEKSQFARFCTLLSAPLGMSL